MNRENLKKILNDSVLMQTDDKGNQRIFIIPMFRRKGVKTALAYSGLVDGDDPVLFAKKVIDEKIEEFEAGIKSTLTELGLDKDWELKPNLRVPDHYKEMLKHL